MNNAALYLAPECLGKILTLVSVIPDYYGHSRERHSDPVGFKYEVLLQAHNYDKLTVKIEGKQLCDAPIAGDNPVVEFVDLKVRPYVNSGTGKLAYTASATDIHIVNTSKPVSKA